MLNINLMTNARVWQTAMGNKNMNPSGDYFDLNEKEKGVRKGVMKKGSSLFLTHIVRVARCEAVRK